MQVICAWCQSEGRPGLLRVREPLDDPTQTHGICDRHQQAVFEAFPSTSFPATRWLFIVPRGDVARYEHLVRLLRDVAGATVIMDRRQGERRRGSGAPSPERRRIDRRVRRPERNSLGYALVRFTVRDPGKPEAPPDATETARDAALEAPAAEHPSEKLPVSRP
jgi:hypothetical protein